MLFTIILSAICIVLLAWVIYLHYNLYRIHKSNKELLKQARGSNLEEILNSQNKHLAKLSQDLKNLEDFTRDLERKLGFTIQKINVVRFNAFSGEGGDQSFSIALLDKHKNGLVISNIKTREGDHVYAKPIKNSQSQYNLTKEELEAINKG